MLIKIFLFTETFYQELSICLVVYFLAWRASILYKLLVPWPSTSETQIFVGFLQWFKHRLCYATVNHWVVCRLGSYWSEKHIAKLNLVKLCLYYKHNFKNMCSYIRTNRLFSKYYISQTKNNKTTCNTFYEINK